jgi:hypothetical protein
MVCTLLKHAACGGDLVRMYNTQLLFFLCSSCLSSANQTCSGHGTCQVIDDTEIVCNCGKSGNANEGFQANGTESCDAPHGHDMACVLYDAFP